LDLHLHERLGEHPNALLEEIRVLIDYRLAQQLRESYSQFIGHRAFSPSVDWSLLKEPHGGRLRQQSLLFTHLRGHYLPKVLLIEVCPSISEINIALTLLENHKEAKIVEGGWVATSARSRAGFMCGSIAFSHGSWTLGQRVNTGSECRTIAATVRARRWRRSDLDIQLLRRVQLL
jgi:hypothetical protein